MESPLTSPSFFPAVPRHNRQSHISIRSITYKKTLAKPDVEVKKEMASTLGRFPSPLHAIISPTSQTRASTTFGSKPGSSPYLPHMSCELHRLTFTSHGNKGSPKKANSSALLPNLKSPKSVTINPFETNYSEQHTNSNRTKAKEMLAAKSPQNDYFKLLFDENRKPFKVEDYSGVDEFYTPDMIMKNIYDQGFRDPEYYATRIEHKSMDIPSERVIQDEFRFKMPVSIAAMENNNTLATHVLGGTLNNINFVESSIGPQEEQLKIIKAEKKRLQNEIEALKKKNEDEIRDIEERFMRQFQQLMTRITEDSINNQNENFKCQKEIALLQRDKLKIEKDIDSLIPPLERLEDVLYGKNIFALEANEKQLEMISSINLRPQVQSSMKNRPIIH